MIDDSGGFFQVCCLGIPLFALLSVNSSIFFISNFFDMFCLDLQLEVSNLTLNGIPTGKDSKDVTVYQHKTGKSFDSVAGGEGVLGRARCRKCIVIKLRDNRAW